MEEPIEKFECHHCDNEHKLRELVEIKKYEGVLGLHCPAAYEEKETSEELGTISYPID